MAVRESGSLSGTVKWQRIQSCIVIDLAPFWAGSIGNVCPPERFHLTSPSIPLKPPGDIYITATRATHVPALVLSKSASGLLYALFGSLSYIYSVRDLWDMV